MSEENGNSTGQSNGAQQNGNQPELRVLAQYVKDLSFENPDAPASLSNNAVSGQTPPQIDVSVGVSLRQHGQEQYEVELKLSATANRDEKTIFVVDMVYGGLFLVRHVPEESLKPVLHIECPRLLFPFARRILADAVRDGGFLPLLLEPIDFAALYRQKIMRESEAAQAPGGSPDKPA